MTTTLEIAFLWIELCAWALVWWNLFGLRNRQAKLERKLEFTQALHGSAIRFIAEHLGFTPRDLARAAVDECDDPSCATCHDDHEAKH